jgi:hypothetical protein
LCLSRYLSKSIKAAALHTQAPQNGLDTLKNFLCLKEKRAGDERLQVKKRKK